MADLDDIHKELFRNRKRRYRNKHKTVCISFTLDVAREIEAEALRYDKTPSEFIRTLIDAHLTGTGYVLPPESKLQELTLSIRSIHTEIHQVTRNYSNGVTPTDIENIVRMLAMLETKVQKALTLPPTLSDIITAHLEEHPETLQSLISFLHAYEHDHQSKTC